MEFFIFILMCLVVLSLWGPIANKKTSRNAFMDGFEDAQEETFEVLQHKFYSRIYPRGENKKIKLTTPIDAAAYAVGVEAYLSSKDKEHSFDNVQEYFLSSWNTKRITNIGTRILRSKTKPQLKEILELDAL